MGSSEAKICFSFPEQAYTDFITMKLFLLHGKQKALLF